MKLIYKLIPLLMVNIAWANDIIPDHIGDNYVHFAGAATIKANMPIGSRIIGPLEGQMSTKVHGSCPRNNIRILVRTSDYNSYVDTYNGNKVYATGTPGIGYAINDYQLNTADRDRWFMWGMVRNNTEFVAGQMGAYAGVSFYKTGDIQPDATITNFNLAKFYLRCLGGNPGPSRLMATLKFVGRLTMKVEQDNNSGSNNGGWNNSGQSGNGNNGGSNNGGWNNGGQGGNGNNGGSNNSGWNNGGQGGNGNNGGSNNGGQGGNNNNGGSNSSGQGGNNNNGGSNNDGQRDNNPNNNNNNNSNSNNSNIWPTH
ncbi:hypothetical protein QE197_03280 [Arsenophonus nasoniae]|nr:hypothetical protein [Arsenophonus nasoniae]QBY42321.1 hypothetical protein ArsFIN_08660 [Arsenophonus nasoniae]WGM02275.1 hypothetical protein QE210_04000 [Arsenophonus nasoniae]WGM11395.1 hypothetical protein QE197_03280 [Arsenophonus nasoniae]WGM16091.1 hypothetical protein QE193_03245 [Arsenophonus nasoniae]